MDNKIWRHSLGDVLHRSAARLPNKIAIQCGSVRWSYAEFDAICDRLAGGLRHLGIQFGDRVAILARNSHAYAALRFAVARLGAVLVPVNFMLRDQEAAYIIRHSGARLLCTDMEFEPLGRRAASLDTAIESLLLLPDEAGTPLPTDALSFDRILDAAGSSIRSEVRADSVAQIIYTSGTESNPKGVVLTHEAVLWNYVSCIVDAAIAEEDVLLHAMPLYHCAQLDVFLGPALYVGASNVITSKPVPDQLLALLSRQRITSFFAPPTVWIALLRSVLFEGTDLSRLSKGYYGASIMPVEVLQELMKRLPHLELYNLYGQTEIAPLAAVLKPHDQLRKAGSAGKPALNVEIRLVDEAGNDVAPGVTGELVHRSPQLLTCYYDDDERTREAFRDDWFHSGDLARMDSEGFITIVDRKKDMIKSGGENIASREVEEALYLHPAVSEAAVIGVPHEKWIEAVLAVVVVKHGCSVTVESILDHCRERLAPFKVPKSVIFAESLPKSPSGKILKREMRHHYVQAVTFDSKA
jgi:fatty-acyl-CoA synthase